MATQNAVGNGLSGSTGTGAFVGANTPTLITPVLGAATGTSLNFGATATNGIIGVNGTTSAGAGVVGQVVSSVIVFASAVNVVSSGVAQNLTSISLTAGDWDVWGNIFFVPSASGAAPSFAAGLSLVTDTLPDLSLCNTLSPTAVIGNIGLCAPSYPMSITATTTVYIVASTTFGAGTCSISGGIYARRIR